MCSFMLNPIRFPMDKINTTRYYIPGFDGLRAIAVLAVFAAHFPLLQEKLGFEAPLNRLAFFNYTGGRTGVILFFILSGFLITTLLLREQEQTNSINLKRFYLKRMLRIWPIYYLILLAVAFLASDSHPETWVLCLLIFPNVANSAGHTLVLSPHLWSIGAEEQFYLIWPFLVKRGRKYLKLILWGIFLFFAILPTVVILVVPDQISWKVELLRLLYLTKFNCFAMGGLAALWVNEHAEDIGSKTIIRFLAYLLFVLTLTLWVIGIGAGRFTDEFYGLLFTALLICLSLYPNCIPQLENRFIRYLGRISYGIYIYHWLLIILSLKLCAGLGHSWNAWTGFFVALGLTIGVSALSFRYFERYFLNKKQLLDR